MDHVEFKRLRSEIGLTQTQLARLLGYQQVQSVRQFEAPGIARAVPPAIARLLTAYAEGYRPKDWPA